MIQADATNPNDPASARRRRVLRVWRIAFVLYAIVLTVATHWPSLNLSPAQGVPAPDKMIHLYAFGILAFLLWRTRWFNRGWVVIGIASAWVVIDEWTQSLPLLDRSFSLGDIIAGELGVAQIGVWAWALRPLGAVPNRTRLATQAFVLDELALQARLWVLIVITLVPIVFAIVRIWPFVEASIPNLVPALIYTTGHLLWLGVVGTIWYRWWQRAASDFRRDRRCLACGERCGAVDVVDDGGGACLHCGTRFHVGQWLEAVSPTSDRRRRMNRRAMGFAGGTIVLLVVVIGAVVLGGEALGYAVIWWINSLPRGMVLSLDLSTLFLAAAMGTYGFRRALASFHDRQDRICRHCAHDLRATPIERGIGRCGECGTAFARFE